MKNKFTKMLALYLSLAIILPTILIPGLFVLADSGAYTAHIMDVYRSSANLQSYGVSNERFDTDLSGIEGPTVKYGWSDASTMNNTAGYFYASLDGIANNGALVDGIQRDGGHRRSRKMVFGACRYDGSGTCARP